VLYLCFFFSSRRRHTRFSRDWSRRVLFRSSHGDGVAVDRGAHADGGRGVEIRGRRDGETSLGCGLADGAGERVLAVGLGGGGQGQQFVLAAGSGRGDAGEGRLAGGQGAGHVEQDGVAGAHLLQRHAVLDQTPALGGALRGD